jgi:histidinol dehydrogenase
MKLIKYPDRSQWNEILKRPVLETENLFDTVRNIIKALSANRSCKQ